jgi:Ca-activated chloride channel family protein
MNTRGKFVQLGLALLVCAAAAGCAPMDASKARSRQVIESGGIVPAEELRVAEYVNYYEQSFPEPTETALGLDLRLGNPQITPGGGEAWLQVGVQARKAQPADIAPLNLALVIDRSGSMGDAAKMSYVKQSLRVFLGSLAVNDIVAIVAYDNSAEVLVSAREVGDGGWIAAAVDRLQPGGSTNLHDGLMLGFQEVDRRFDVRRNNRVILLTDGIANMGVTDPERITAAAKAYHDRGVYLSTIGVGRDFNDALLSRLAIQGRGAYHFIDSAAEMDKVFRRDALGLVQKAAEGVAVVFRPESGVQVLALTGYQGVPPAGPIEVALRDMGTGDSQVLLAQLRVAPGPAGRRILASVELRYTDLLAARPETIVLPVQAQASTLSAYDPLWDVEVLRNVTIQRTAEVLREISQLYQAQRYQEAWNLAHESEADLRTVAALTGEKQMAEDADLMRRYQDTLAQWVRRQTGRGPEDAVVPEPTRFYRGRQLEITPAVPVLDVQ